MPDPSLGRLLISHITLRGPELAQLYDLIVASPGIPYDQIVHSLVPAGGAGLEFGLDEAPLREALNFLMVAGLVTQSGPSRRKGKFFSGTHLDERSFPLVLLYHIRNHPQERQRAITDVHAQLVGDNVLMLTPQTIRERMERSPASSLFAWTGEKITFWTHITSYLGLTRRIERSLDVLVLPRPSVILAALRWAGALPDAPRSLDLCLRTINTSLFTCFSSRGDVHVGLAQTLTLLHQRGAIRLTHSTDAARSVLLGRWRVSDVELVFPKRTAS